MFKFPSESVSVTLSYKTVCITDLTERARERAKWRDAETLIQKAVIWWEIIFFKKQFAQLGIEYKSYHDSKPQPNRFSYGLDSIV